MKEDIPWKLLEGYFEGSLTKEENEKFHLWLFKMPENRVIFNQLKAYYIEHDCLPNDFKPNSAIALEVIHTRIHAEKPVKKLNFSLWMKLAALVILFLGGYWFFQNQYVNGVNNLMIVATQDEPIRRYLLPDGSTVWINSHSVLKYDKDFEISRNVYLIGEAFFEVAHDTLHPFRVYANHSETRVVGTKFNIRAASGEEKVQLTVENGKVIFGMENDKKQFFTKGQQAVLDLRDNKLEKMKQVDVNALAWKTKSFYFEQEKLEMVLLKLSEVYHFKYQIENKDLQNYPLTARFRQRSLNEILKTISIVTDSKINRKADYYEIKAN